MSNHASKTRTVVGAFMTKESQKKLGRLKRQAVRGGRNGAFSISDFGELIIKLTPEGKQELEELLDKWRTDGKYSYDSIWWDMFEDIFVNSSWSEVRPELIGALTSAPIFGWGAQLNDAGDAIEENEDTTYWWFERYQIQCPYEELLEKGEVRFECGGGLS